MTTWWADRLNEQRTQQRPLPAPQIPQHEQPEDQGIDSLVEQARASLQQIRPAQDVAERFSVEPGADVKVYSTGRDMRETNAFNTPADQEAAANDLLNNG